MALYTFIDNYNILIIIIIKTKQSKKIFTNDASIDEAESILNISFPNELRDIMKQRNGFYMAGFRFYPVLDKDDVQHTFDDVVRENKNMNFLPAGYVAIADMDGNWFLSLSTNKDGKIYILDNANRKIEIYAENGSAFINRLNKENDEVENLE